RCPFLTTSAGAYMPEIPGSFMPEGDKQLCPSAGGQSFRVQQQQAYVLSPDSAGYINSIVQPFDYTVAAGFWGVAFTTIVGLWLVSHGAGAIVNFLRRA
ncbi:hypothetical protein, partial [Burkholderia ubonensis]|uniref:hypothetical protein n=1 Tax=Burkholderia ubonensis TaxID=101571 RepID=UPI001E459259